MQRSARSAVLEDFDDNWKTDYIFLHDAPAIWLPAGASAFNVVLMKRFFDNLPRELFEAAKIDGAGPVRLFFSIVLPLSKPILGVVSIFRDPRRVEELSLAVPRLDQQSRPPAPLCSATSDSAPDADRRAAGLDADRVPRAADRIPGLPAHVLAGHGTWRRAQGLMPANPAG
jgi:Binding-protein-dependent transport system inner membrane component